MSNIINDYSLFVLFIVSIYFYLIKMTIAITSTSIDIDSINTFMFLYHHQLFIMY